MKRKIYDQDAVVAEYLAGDSCPTIARRYAVTVGAISYIVRKYGIKGKRPIRKLPSREVVVADYESGMTMRAMASKYNVSCGAVQKELRKAGVPGRPYIPAKMIGNTHPLWKGDQVGYASAHDRVKRRRGKPSLCEHCGTTKAKYFDWANLTGNYGDSSDYIRLCRSCHAKFDRSGERERLMQKQMPELVAAG